MSSQFRKSFAITELPIISELILNFNNKIIPIFAKLRNMELATFSGLSLNIWFLHTFSALHRNILQLTLVLINQGQ